ncbi:MAG: UvrD-helicase domain-containing protein [Planctomycetota bacterium]
MKKDRTCPYPNVVIRASAGTGKTFALSNRFIGLAVDGAPIDSILASTFTRKAAGEILDRVLLRLAEAALDPGACSELARFIAPVQLDSEICLGTLRKMLCHLHRLRISTLDSFFLQIAGSFSLELGLPPGWRIMDDFTHGQLQSEAIQVLLQKAETSELTRLMHLIQRTEASRSVNRSIKNVVNPLLALFMEAPWDAWESLPLLPVLSQAEQENSLFALASLPVPDKRFENAREKDMQQFRNREWELFLKNGLSTCVFNHKTHYYRKELSPELQSAYEPLIRHAYGVLLNRIADQTRATGKLIAQFDQVLQALKQQRRLLRFEDITRMLISSWPAGRMSDVDYRLDAQSSHLLLDEFQDTSPLQWHVLKPFAKEAVEPKRGRSFFCVGDVKQAIYGWRGGVAEIFDVIGSELGGLQSEAMDKSYRSSPPVIDAVNQLFGKINENAALSTYREAADRWVRRFSLHTTQHLDMPGYFCLESAAESLADEDKEDACLVWAAARVAELHHRDPEKVIGVLLRKNEAIGTVIRLLRSCHGIRASEEGGNPLSDSPAVELVLSLLRIADHPGDGPARFHVAHSPLAETIGYSDHADDLAAWELSRRVRRDLMTDGYGEVIQRWTRALSGFLDRRDLSRLMQLTELAYAYEATATPRTRDFDGLVRGRRVESPTTDRVRVMTVHKSKGLQFDIVLLPELHSSMTGQIPQLVSGRPGPSESIDRLCRYVPLYLRPVLPGALAKAFEEYDNQRIEEALCVLYVAMTRAKYALHMIIPPTITKGRGRSASYEALLREAFCNGEPAPPETVLAESGDPDWFRAVPGQRNTGAEPDPDADCHASVKLAKGAGKRVRNLDRIRPSQLEGGATIELSQHLLLSNQEALSRGTLIHAWFELIEWLEKGEPEDAALLEAARAVSHPVSDMENMIASFRKAVAIPAVRELLSLSAYSSPERAGLSCKACITTGISKPRWKVWREKPFVIRDGDALLSGTMDRVVVLYDHDRAVGADVVDFKTDRIASGDIEERIAFYGPQLRAYRLAACRLFHLDPIRVSTRLAFVEPGIIEDVQ